MSTTYIRAEKATGQYASWRMEMDKAKLLLVKWTPWWVLRALWKCRIVERTTVLRWEVNQCINEWKGP